jgi:hypothetical protein
VRPGEGPFAELTARVQPVHREQVFMPQTEHPGPCPKAPKRDGESTLKNLTSDPGSSGTRPCRTHVARSSSPIFVVSHCRDSRA